MQEKIKRFVFWQYIKSFHQSAFMRALAADFGVEVIFAYEDDIPQDRRAMGWIEPNFGLAKTLDVRIGENWNSLASMTDDTTCHVFGNYHTLPHAYRAFKKLRHADCRLGWISEAFNFTGWKGFLRTQRMRWHALTEARTAFDRVFAMGDLGTRFFQSAWISSDALREFVYTVDSMRDADDVEEQPDDGTIRLIFVGQLIKRKGLDILLRALANVEANWSLDVVGDGGERASLISLCKQLGLERKVTFHGNCANHDVIRLIKQAQALVLPSRWDGWGAVINESLECGTPVIVSDKCGAASLVRSPAHGRVFCSENVADLAGKLRQQLADTRGVAASRTALLAWTQEAISARVVARYFVDCWNNGQAIQAPWRHGKHLDEGGTKR